MSRIRIIPTVKHSDQFLGKLEDGLTYSILNPANNYHSVEEMYEIYKAVHGSDMTKPVIDLVAFRPDRILRQEAIIGISSTLRLRDLDEDLKMKYNAVVESINIKNFVAEGDALRTANLEEMKKISRALQDGNIASIPDSTYKRMFLTVSLHKDYTSDEHSPLEMRAVIAANRLTNEMLRERAISEVTRSLESLVSFSEAVPLSKRTASSRNSAAINGPIASGKGSSEALIRYKVEHEFSRDWDDSIKINGDSYKGLLNPEYSGATGMRAEVFSQLVQDEASFIKATLSKRIQKELDVTGSAPDVVVDANSCTDLEIDNATKGGGKMTGAIVFIPVEKALERALARGDTTGRYEHTEVMLTQHKGAIERFIQIIADRPDQHIEYTLLNNDVPRGAQANKVATFDCARKEIKIYDVDSFKAFLSKTQLDPARTMAEGTICYQQYNNATLFAEFLAKMEGSGYTVNLVAGSHTFEKEHEVYRPEEGAHKMPVGSNPVASAKKGFEIT